MQTIKKTLIASASEIQSSELYMTIKATLFTVPDANLNGVRCTGAFLDDIIEHGDQYIGLPLCADVSNLTQGKYEKLGHCYDPQTDTFATSMIGSFYQFEKESKDGTDALVGYARVLKRNKNVCKALSELFLNNALKFSFEIACGSYRELDDGTVEIDRDESNYLEGMCVVSFPACPEAVAQLLVAEIINNDSKETEAMPKEKEAVIAEVTEEIASAPEEPASEPEVETAEEAEQTEEPKETETAEEIQETETAEETKETETAEKVTHEVKEVTERKSEYDTETGEETAVEASHTEWKTYISELTQKIDNLTKEIAEMKANLAAEKEKEPEVPVALAAQENPFVEDMSAQGKYGLLEKAYDRKGYSLLDKAD